VAVLNKSGALLAHDRGHVEYLREIRVGVSRFQLEREWVAVLRHNELEIARADRLRDLEFMPQGTSVNDFERK
jgi:hypothetical protein